MAHIKKKNLREISWKVNSLAQYKLCILHSPLGFWCTWFTILIKGKASIGPAIYQMLRNF